MKHDEKKWNAAYQKSFKMLTDSNFAAKHDLGPASGHTCLLASLIYIRDGCKEDWGGKAKSPAECALLDESIKELRESIFTMGDKLGKHWGFACNASAAAQSAGFKEASASAVVSALKDE